MRDVLGSGTHLGYCTNVHPGESLSAVRDNLRLHAVAVKTALKLTEPMGVGLWLSAAAAEELSAARELRRLRDLIDECGLYIFTLNGFPYGDFQRPVVKHDVYRPNWATRKRFDYTIRLIDILAELLPPDVEGSISTLPLGWRGDLSKSDDVSWAADSLREIADHLHDVDAYRKRRIHVSLEPEPGCFLDTSADVVAFFNTHLLTGDRSDRIRRHIRICHDICHAAVMFESQAACFERYAGAGIGVGKVQISSALRFIPSTFEIDARAAALAEYAAFAEPRFLHQTVLRESELGKTTFFDDLPAALADSGISDLKPQISDLESQITGPHASRSEWRTHFHVPIFLDRIGQLGTTQCEISDALRSARALSTCTHFEVETYAWNVLPPPQCIDPVTDGIARELQWVRGLAHFELNG